MTKGITAAKRGRFPDPDDDDHPTPAAAEPALAPDEAMPGRTTCGSCNWFIARKDAAPVIGAVLNGNCCGGPPTAFAMPTATGIVFNSIYPPVAANFPSCRVYRLRSATSDLEAAEPMSRA